MELSTRPLANIPIRLPSLQVQNVLDKPEEQVSQQPSFFKKYIVPGLIAGLGVAAAGALVKRQYNIKNKERQHSFLTKVDLQEKQVFKSRQDRIQEFIQQVENRLQELKTKFSLEPNHSQNLNKNELEYVQLQKLLAEPEKINDMTIASYRYIISPYTPYKRQLQIIQKKNS